MNRLAGPEVYGMIHFRVARAIRLSFRIYSPRRVIAHDPISAHPFRLKQDLHLMKHSLESKLVLPVLKKKTKAQEPITERYNPMLSFGEKGSFLTHYNAKGHTYVPNPIQ